MDKNETPYAMRTVLSFLLLFSLLFIHPADTAAGRGSSTGTPNIVPVPLKTEHLNGFYRLHEKSQVVTGLVDSRDVMRLGEMIAGTLRNYTGFAIPVVSVAGSGTRANIELKIIPDKENLGSEGYRLSIRKTGILLEAPSAHGLFYGINSLFQLFPAGLLMTGEQEKQNPKIPCMVITDKPRYSYRGMHLDVSRHFFSKEFIFRYIDLIAMWKMNVFHWHLTDDNGWRIEIRKYPKLQSVSAWRVNREDKPWNERPFQQVGEPANYGGYYTQEEIREVVQYAADRFITIIPEIEMPAHSREVLAAYPQFSCTGGPFTVPPGGYRPNIDIFCAGNDSVFTFLEGVLTEVMELFPGPYIHIGGDEADKTNWKSCGKCQNRIQKEGLKDVDELQSYFIKRIERFANSQGRKIIGWDEILEGGLAPEATVMSWRGVDGGIDAARQGHDVIMTPTSHCYFDYYQADPEFQPPAIGGLTTLEKVYSFEPTPPELNVQEATHILGAQGNLWSEFIPTPRQAEYMAVPRMAALAEVVWSSKENRNRDDFRQRMSHQYERLQALDVNYCKGSYAVSFQTVFDTLKQQIAISMDAEILDPEIRYSIDGSVPSVASKKYTRPVVVNASTRFAAAIFENGQLMEKPVTRNFDKHAGIGKQVKFMQKPSNRYPGQGKQTLTDGWHGTTYHRDGMWLGFHGNDMELIIDLGKPTAVSKVTISALQNTGSWIFLPLEVKVNALDEKEELRITGTKKNDEKDNTSVFLRNFSIPLLKTPVRYLHIRAKNQGVCPEWHPGAGQKSWIFIDEIVVE